MYISQRLITCWNGLVSRPNMHWLVHHIKITKLFRCLEKFKTFLPRPRHFSQGQGQGEAFALLSWGKARHLGMRLEAASKWDIASRHYSTANNCRSKASKAMQRVRLLRLVSGQKWGANSRTLLKLYKQYIRPVLEYGNVATCNATKTNLLCLQRVQNSALRLTLQAARWSKVKEMHDIPGIELLTECLRSLCCKAKTRYGNS